MPQGKINPSPKNKQLLENLGLLGLRRKLDDEQIQKIRALLAGQQAPVSALDNDDCPDLSDPTHPPAQYLCELLARLTYLLNEQTCEVYEANHAACAPE